MCGEYAWGIVAVTQIYD